MVYINKGEHDNPHELPNQTHLEVYMTTEQTMYSHTLTDSHKNDSFNKLQYIYKHFQDIDKIHPSDLHVGTQNKDNTLYLHINNDIEYGIFEDIISSYYLDSEIKDDFHCYQKYYSDKQPIKQNEQLHHAHMHTITFHNT